VTGKESMKIGAFRIGVDVGGFEKI